MSCNSSKYGLDIVGKYARVILDKGVRFGGCGQCERSAWRQADINIGRFARLAHECLDVVDERIAHVHGYCRFLQHCKRLRRNGGLDLVEH